jgi:molybdenum cofactor biosynthesis enzyme MoaA
MVNIKNIQIELTTKCNASCPQCVRTIFGGETNKNIPNAELFLEDIKNVFPKRQMQKINKICLSGLVGDPVMADDFVEIINYFSSSNPSIKIELHTNGSIRSAKTWADIGQKFNKNLLVIFGIDGIGQTNSIYRRKTQWYKIISNAKSFINAGGHAKWNFIVFKHNEHQIESVRRIAKKMGFRDIEFVISERFFDFGSYSHMSSTPIYDFNGKEINRLMPPENKQWRSPLETIMQKNNISEIKNQIDISTISCMSNNMSEIYITAEGFIFPCCWFGLLYYLGGEKCNLVYLGNDYNKYLHDYIQYKKIFNILPSIKCCQSIEFFKLKMQEYSKLLALPSINKGKPSICSVVCGLWMKKYFNNNVILKYDNAKKQ